MYKAFDMSLEKFKLKLHEQLLEWLQEGLTLAGEETGEPEPSTLLAGMADGTSALGNLLEVTYRVKPRQPCDQPFHS